MAVRVLESRGERIIADVAESLRVAANLLSRVEEDARQCCGAGAQGAWRRTTRRGAEASATRECAAVAVPGLSCGYFGRSVAS